jgi:hypothetical protein
VLALRGAAGFLDTVGLAAVLALRATAAFLATAALRGAAGLRATGALRAVAFTGGFAEVTIRISFNDVNRLYRLHNLLVKRQ